MSMYSINNNGMTLNHFIFIRNINSINRLFKRSGLKEMKRINIREQGVKLLR